MDEMGLMSFWKNKNILLTGHNGFKGSWLSFILNKFEANVTGISLENQTSPNLFEALDLNNNLNSINFNIENYSAFNDVINEIRPEIVIHMAAQPLVGLSYAKPLETFSSNTLGTLNILESTRNNACVKSLLIITSDKCYLNQDSQEGYKEEDKLGGHDPYSASKAAAEIISQSYIKSFFNKDLKRDIGVATARAGNVIGGGDWSRDRIIPDVIRSFYDKKHLDIRNISGIRPWQHVLDSIFGYLELVEKLYKLSDEYSGPWNFGPDKNSIKSVKYILENFEKINGKLNYRINSDKSYKETNLLLLDSSKSLNELNWKPTWDIDQSLEYTFNWYKSFYEGINMKEYTMHQIDNYLTDKKKKR